MRVAGRLEPARWGEAARRDERRVRERNKISGEEGGWIAEEDEQQGRQVEEGG